MSMDDAVDLGSADGIQIAVPVIWGHASKAGDRAIVADLAAMTGWFAGRTADTIPENRKHM
jgi:hypothetical protein